jgi:uncharacterized protein (TIGR03083 family)
MIGDPTNETAVAGPLAGALQALEATWRVWARLGEGMDEADWSRPSRNARWTVKETYAHHSRAVLRLAEFAQAPTTLPAEHRDAASFLGQFGRRPDDAGLVEVAAQAEAAAATPAELIATFRDLGPRAIDTARATGELVVQTDEGRIVLSEYVRTRVVEAVLHLLDVQRDLGLPPDVPEDALRTTAHVLVDFAPPIDFVEVVTGRSNLSIFPLFW